MFCSQLCLHLCFSQHCTVLPITNWILACASYVWKLTRDKTIHQAQNKLKALMTPTVGKFEVLRLSNSSPAIFGWRASARQSQLKSCNQMILADSWTHCSAFSWSLHERNINCQNTEHVTLKTESRGSLTARSQGLRHCSKRSCPPCYPSRILWTF